MTPNIPNIWEIFPALTRAVRDKHRAVGTGGGHDFDHDLSVAQTALHVGWSVSEKDASLAGAAALCHSADWILTEKNNLGKSGNLSRCSREDAQELVLTLLNEHTTLLSEEKERILFAVLNHGKRNEPEDDLVLVLLTEADRLVNMGCTVIIRAGQHHSMLQEFNPVSIEIDQTGRPYREQYAHPDSVAWDLENCAKWANSTNPYCLRTPKGVEMGNRRASFLRAFLWLIKDEREELGLYPYPEQLL